MSEFEKVMERTFTEQLEAYNEAIRVANEEERLMAEGKWQSAAKAKAWKRDMLDLIKRQANEEFDAIQDYQNGKIDQPVTCMMKRGKQIAEPLFYFENPEIFESEIANLDNCLGELTYADQAWINNTRKLIKMHRAVVAGESEKEQKEAWEKGQDKAITQVA
jgi:hypothetical protein